MQTSSVFALKEVLSEKKIYFVLKEGLSDQREQNALKKLAIVGLKEE
jgi:hypothetical protein